MRSGARFRATVDRAPYLSPVDIGVAIIVLNFSPNGQIDLLIEATMDPHGDEAAYTISGDINMPPESELESIRISDDETNETAPTSIHVMVRRGCLRCFHAHLVMFRCPRPGTHMPVMHRFDLNFTAPSAPDSGMGAALAAGCRYGGHN